MNSQNALTKWALAQQNNWNGLKESDEAGEEILRGYNNRMGVKYNPTDAWSAITISNAVMTNMGAEDKNSALSALNCKWGRTFTMLPLDVAGEAQIYVYKEVVNYYKAVNNFH